MASPADIEEKSRTNGLAAKDPTNRPKTDQGLSTGRSQREPPPADAEPKKKRSRYEPTAGSTVRGMKLPLYPKPAQASAFDMWRQRARSLWNLLLGMEMAAYSGEDRHPELGWRQIWASVVEEFYARDVDQWHNGRKRKDGTFRREPGQGKEPVVPDATMLEKILNPVAQESSREAEQEASNRPEGPKLFIWERELNAVMARLKQVSRSRWVGDLPSHAAQHVVKDLIKALQTMLREKKKRASGVGGRMAGFPRFKPNRYAEGSVYFANTQLKWDLDRSRVWFPNGVGWVKYDGSTIEKGDKFMGARLWRQGEKWWLSPQFEMPVPAAPPFTGREVGVKVAAGTLATVYDGASFEELAGHHEDRRYQRRLKLWGRKLARRREAQAERETKVASRKGVKRVRIRRSSGFYEASAALAKQHGRESNQKNDILHKASRRIVNEADHITIERIDVAGMTKRSDHLAAKRQRRAERRRRANAATAPANGASPPASAAPEAGTATAIRHKAPHRVLRKAMRRAAVARFLGFIAYKAADGARTLTETHELLPRVQECAKCHTLHPVMKDGRVVLRCPGCGGVMRRQINAAENIYRQGQISLGSGLEPET